MRRSSLFFDSEPSIQAKSVTVNSIYLSKPKFEKIPRAALPRQLSADAYEHFNQFAEFLTGSDDHSWSDLLEHSPAMRDQRKLLGGENMKGQRDSERGTRWREEIIWGGFRGAP
eukprot:g7933.t1